MVKEKHHFYKGTDGIVSTHGQAEGEMSGSECLAGCIEDRLQEWWAGGCEVGWLTEEGLTHLVLRSLNWKSISKQSSTTTESRTRSLQSPVAGRTWLWQFPCIEKLALSSFYISLLPKWQRAAETLWHLVLTATQPRSMLCLSSTHYTWVELPMTALCLSRLFL